MAELFTWNKSTWSAIRRLTMNGRRREMKKKELLQRKIIVKEEARNDK